MILRHITPISHLHSIVSDNKLRADAKPNKKNLDANYVALEIYNESRVLPIIKIMANEGNKDTYSNGFVAFYFDSGKIEASGIKIIHKDEAFIVDEHGKKKPFADKRENLIYITNHELLKMGVDSNQHTISKSEYDSIGEYVFIKGELSLDLLTDDSKRLLHTIYPNEYPAP